MMTIPKFRSTRRLVHWVNSFNHQRNRLPRENEQCFFENKKESEMAIAGNAINYASNVGPLDSDFEKIISKSNTAIVRYSTILASWPSEKGGRRVLPREMEQKLINDDKFLFEYAMVRRNHLDVYGEAKLPEYLENSISKPDVAYKYARDILKSRLSKSFEERIFNKTKTEDMGSAYAVRSVLARYAEFVGPLEPELESLFEDGSKEEVINYIRVLHSHKKDPSAQLLSYLKGDDKNLLFYARMISKRLPTDLEDTLSNPKICYDYAREIVKGRLPEHLEEVFLKDYTMATEYAFNIVRGYASVKLPEKLHAMMLMKSYENPNDWSVRKYFQSCD